MNIALILAGGRGKRTGQDIPKQFINVYDRPIIIYTLEVFQKHPDIHKIAVVCLDGWTDILTSYAKQYNISKLSWVIAGGLTSQESIRNGVFHLEDICQADDIVVIHDGIRPMIEESVLSDVIVKCKLYGNAVSSLPYTEQIFKIKDEQTTVEYIPRETLRRVSTPQAYRYDKLLWGYKEAFAKGIGIHESSYTNTMMVDLGETLYLANGSDKNIKITTAEDLEIFKALLCGKQTNWLK